MSLLLPHDWRDTGRQKIMYPPIQVMACARCGAVGWVRGRVVGTQVVFVDPVEVQTGEMECRLFVARRLWPMIKVGSDASGDLYRYAGHPR